MRVLVIGGGIAGLSAARALATRGAHVTLVERELHFFAHSSGHNAAMFRPLERHPATCRLAQRSTEILDTLFGGERARWLDARGMILCAQGEAALAELTGIARDVGVAVQQLDGAEIVEKVPHAAELSASLGLFLPGAGVIDIHAVAIELERRARSAGAELRRGEEVEQLSSTEHRVTGVVLKGGERLLADVTVLAAGAWNAGLGKAVGADLPLVPHRRHLVQLVPHVPMPRAPILWQLDPEIYFRNEGGGVLASPCDHEPTVPGIPGTEERVLRSLGEKLQSVSPSLATAEVRRAWACLRTLSPDGQMIVGPDPRALGLAWLSGLAGHGMSAGVAAGELLADTLLSDALHGVTSELAAELSPERYIPPG
jgi:glycine/D-amino acid oxidase-like deaminating enzyme